MDWGYNMARELCTCRSPIISIDSYCTEPDANGHIDQIQKFGCLNKDCPKYKVPIRQTKTSVNY